MSRQKRKRTKNRKDTVVITLVPLSIERALLLSDRYSVYDLITYINLGYSYCLETDELLCPHTVALLESMQQDE